MKILVLNSGSSSIKYRLFDLPALALLAWGLLERIGSPDGRLVHHDRKADGTYGSTVEARPAADHREGLGRVIAALAGCGAVGDGKELFGIGHRVVHGGEIFLEPTRIDGAAVKAIRSLIPLAPLHNGPNLLGIEVALELFPRVPQVAVFDTAFHRTIPPRAFRYALPRALCREWAIRRYGFHGLSHAFMMREACVFLGRPESAADLVTIHLGNGASAAAIKDGRCVDTSMGMTPLEGLMMGTRCGDIDPAVVFHLARMTGRPNDEIEAILYRESGLKGVCGESDMREVHRLAEGGDEDARLALEMYCYRVRKCIGAYFAVLGRLDALVFSGGIGENDPAVRRRACEGLEGLGILIDEERNLAESREPRAIQKRGERVKVLVVPADEELEIARRTGECLIREAGAT